MQKWQKLAESSISFELLHRRRRRTITMTSSLSLYVPSNRISWQLIRQIKQQASKRM
jgi:hypothetical protein